MDALTKLTKARTKLLLHSPFFSTLVLKLQLIEADHIKTMATDGYSILYNPNFVDSMDLDETQGVICHETAHCMLLHPTRRGARCPNRWNAACDYAINALLLDDFHLTLPADRLYSPEFKGMSAEEIYNHLPQTTEMPAWGTVLDAAGEMSNEQLENDWTIATKVAAETAKAAGNLPKALKNLVNKARAQINWREQLHRGLTAVAKTDYSWYPPNIQYIQHGLHIPTLSAPSLGHIVLAIDTSGSVSPHELSQFMGELQHILDTLTFESLTVAQCDSAIRHVQVFEPGEDVEANVYGQGGTRFGPVFDLCNAQTTDLLIYCTDMGLNDPWPTQPDYPVYWARTAEHTAPFGTYIDLFKERHAH